MIETVFAVLIVTSIFLCLFKLSHMLTGKILLEHAAMRVARARSVGFNDFMCTKIARVATIPVAGKRLWPEDDTIDASAVIGRVSAYMQAKDGPVARGVLEYEGWSRLAVDPGDGTKTRVSQDFELFEAPKTAFSLEGEAGIEKNHTLYMFDQGQ